MHHPSPLAWIKSPSHDPWSRKLALSALLFALILVAGCSDVPTNPRPSDISAGSSALGGGGFEPAFNLEWTVTQLVLKRGGAMKLDGERLTCTFANGALPVAEALIIAKMKLNAPRGSATRLEIDFQPSMTFKKDVTLKVDSSYLVGPGNKYVLWFYNPSTRKWVIEKERSFSNGQPVQFNLTHYSAYAVTRKI